MDIVAKLLFFVIAIWMLICVLRITDAVERIDSKIKEKPRSAEYDERKVS